ncbi:MAG: A24 family peptidase [Anaerolineae bacterium]|jgi:prepilin signal peptidase PulO-like enzyme (type II secretory pathway)|nr:A24 family peptidase [Anaerolineae bacterium]
MEYIAALIVGFLAGVLVNALSDDLPYRRRPARPTYADGTPRPLLAWSGLLAFATGQRRPAVPAPNPARQRGEPAALSWRYPLTELLTMFLMVLMIHAALHEPRMSLLQVVFWGLYMVMFALVVVIDIEHKLILFVVVIPSAGLALLNVILTPETATPTTLENAFWGAVAGFVPFFILYQGGFIFTYIMGQVRGQRIDTVAFGYGDVMLMTLSGLLLGLDRTIIGLFITVFLGAAGALGYMLLRLVLRERYSLFTAIPYGPYIVAASVLMLLYGAQVRVALLGY